MISMGIRHVEIDKSIFINRLAFSMNIRHLEIKIREGQAVETGWCYGCSLR